ncbi:Trypsin [Phytophthora infestans]|uniref:Trypsin n=1 Tax=Phytophthora infestans TaxID=4787 RepID=A0A833SFX4_PHYIN|nr:Trypsin [Phytophthora infestans]
MLCIVVQGEDDAGVSTIRKHLRQLPLQSTQQEARELSIFGTDGRQQVTDPIAYPYSAVGLLQWNDITCTATLVASNIALTAAECVLDSKGELLDSAQSKSEFTLPQATETKTASVTRVHKQSDFWVQWTNNTYVLIELDAELGASNNLLLPTANTFAQDDPMNVQFVGYGCNGESGACFQLCKIHFPSEFSGPDYMLHHDCDVSGQRSAGSPMLIRSTNMDTYIVGMHTNAIGDDRVEDTTYSSYNDSVANRGVLGSFVQPQLSFLLERAESSASSDVASSISSFMSSSGSAVSDFASNSHSRSQEPEDQTDAGASEALAPSAASSSSTETTVASGQLGIGTTAAYTCIGVVCATWLAIIFAAGRRIRSNR